MFTFALQSVQIKAHAWSLHVSATSPHFSSQLPCIQSSHNKKRSPKLPSIMLSLLRFIKGQRAARVKEAWSDSKHRRHKLNSECKKMQVACLICDGFMKLKYKNRFLTLYRYHFTLILKSSHFLTYGESLYDTLSNRRLPAHAAKQLIVSFLCGILLSNNQPLWLWQYELLCCRSVQQRPREMRHQHDYTVSCLQLIYCDSTNSLQNHVVRC